MTESRILEEVLESVGGAEVLRDQFDRFERVTRNFHRHQAEWTALYPHRWVIVTAEGVVTDTDSLEDAVAWAHREGLDSSDCIVRYLDPDPPTLLL